MRFWISAVGTGQKIKPEDVLGEPIKGTKVVVLVIPVIPMKLQDADYKVRLKLPKKSWLKLKSTLI